MGTFSTQPWNIARLLLGGFLISGGDRHLSLLRTLWSFYISFNEELIWKEKKNLFF